MQPSILSIGNATNDSFLEIKDNQQFFSDENNIFHFNLTFDDSELEYKKVAGVFGGVILSDKIFRAAHLKSFSDINPQGFANFSPENSEFESIVRYVIMHENSSFVLSADNREMNWMAPKYVPGLIYVAENGFSDEYLHEFENYLDEHKNVKVAFSLEDFLDNKELAKKMLKRAEFVFADYKTDFSEFGLDYDSEEKLAEELIKLGVKNVLIISGEDIFAANEQNAVKLRSDFKINSFFQNSILKAAFLAEQFFSDDISDSLKTAMAIANESDFYDIVKPLIARQVMTREKDKYEVEVLKYNPNLTEKLHETAQALVARPKGIFAADESGGNIHKKFEQAGIEDTEENRRRYREMFFTAPDIHNYLSGVILFEETTDQKTNNGENFVDYIKGRGMFSGVKLDEGLVPFTGFDGETVTKGLDDLEERLEKYAKKGLSFAKWRVAFDIDAGFEFDRDDFPSNAAIAANVQILARYAKACQKFGIVPIVEPEVVYAGKHSLSQCKVATQRILHSLFEELSLFEVDLRGTILKVNMVLSGKENAHYSDPREVAKETVEVLRDAVPKDLAGIVFLSGGQTVYQATDNLQAITNLGPFDWGVTYSYARALQEPALEAWAGKDENIRQAQLVFLERVAANSHALYKN